MMSSRSSDDRKGVVMLILEELFDLGEDGAAGGWRGEEK